MAEAPSPSIRKPMTIREELTNQLRHHESKCKDIQAALDSLSPDVERALDALQKLSY